MRLDQLRFFVAAAESGSISEAARRVHLAQPAFSAHIKTLEYDLGVTLFLRSRRGVMLTDAGQRLYDGAVALFRHVDQVREETISAGTDLAGEVRLVLAGSLTPLLAGQIFFDTHHAYPNIRLSILDLLRVSSETMVAARLVDFGLLPNAATLVGAASEPVLSQELYLVGRQLPGCAGGEVPFRELHRYPLVMGGRRNQLRIDLENTAARTSQRINVVSEQDSLSVYRSIVLNGPFYTVVPYSAYSAEIEHGSLAAARIVEPIVERTTSFVWHAHSELSSGARAVMELLKLRIRDMVQKGGLRGRLIQPT
ncbi:MAG: LysR family transcriptional regulator [Rhizobiaceae bacterium]